MFAPFLHLLQCCFRAQIWPVAGPDSACRPWSDGQSRPNVVCRLTFCQQSMLSKTNKMVRKFKLKKKIPINILPGSKEQICLLAKNGPLYGGAAAVGVLVVCVDDDTAVVAVAAVADQMKLWNYLCSC